LRVRVCIPRAGFCGAGVRQPVGSSSAQVFSSKLVDGLVELFEPRLIGGWREIQLGNPSARLSDGFMDGICAGRNGKSPIADFDKFNTVAGLQSKLFSHVGGKGNSTIEG